MGAFGRNQYSYSVEKAGIWVSSRVQGSCLVQPFRNRAVNLLLGNCCRAIAVGIAPTTGKLWTVLKPEAPIMTWVTEIRYMFTLRKHLMELMDKPSGSLGSTR